MLKNKKIVIGISGGIASYKIASLVSRLSQDGNIIKVVMTKHAMEFITPLTMQTLSKNTVITDMFNDIEYEYVSHIHYSQEYDLMIIAPATANIIGKAANGIADDMLSSMIIAATIPVVFIPSMNEHMYENKIVQNNINKLKEFGYKVLEPGTGHLACGVNGKGKLPSTKEIIDFIDTL